jgi:two-component system sensor histidine kinase QseC
MTASTGDKAVIRLCDQGPGIPEPDRDKALSRFTRLDQRIGSGAGLGLAGNNRQPGSTE